jgi:UDP-N-acetylmuramate--alanine ligase
MIDGKSFFLVGIGGSGMMPLAAILRGRGATVAGSDRGLDAGRVPAKFDSLRALGIELYPQDGSGVTAPDQIVVASAAVEDTVADIVRARELGCERMRRADLLASLFNASRQGIAVGGTSGKSTVTGMIGWILHACGRDPTVMNGAVMTNFAGPDAPFASALVGAGEAFVSEVDESDGSIALYEPAVAVLNNVSLDHKGLEELRLLFGDFLDRAGTAIVNIDNDEAAALAPLGTATVAIDKPADLRATDLREEPFAVGFTLEVGDERLPVRLQVPGRHTVSNALCALAAARAAGVPLAEAAEAIGNFTGLKRRFERIGEAGGVTVIDDFGHNPDKIAATLDTLHAFPGRLLILFQPHGYGPLKVMRAELAAMFRERLGPGDRLFLPDPVYQGGTVSREVTSADLVADIGESATHIADRNAAAAALLAEARPGDRIVIMGARDDTLGLLAQDMLRQLETRGT